MDENEKINQPLEGQQVPGKRTMKDRIKNIRKRTLGIIIVLLLLILGFSGNENMEQISTLNKQVDTLQSDYDELKAENQELNQQLADADKVNKTLRSEAKEYKDQQKTVEELTKQAGDLQKQCTDLQSENESLKSQLSSLQSQTSQKPASDTAGISVANNTGGDTGGMVWLSATGDKYHSIPNCGRMNPNKARQVTKASAEASGYAACSKCW